VAIKLLWMQQRVSRGQKLKLSMLFATRATEQKRTASSNMSPFEIQHASGQCAYQYQPPMSKYIGMW